jgi:transcriptional regulator of arginine metabolism
MRKAESAGPNLLLIFTDAGSAEMVAMAIRSAKWPEVVGSVAWNDTVFLATHNAQEQRRLFKRFKKILDTYDENVL